MAEREDESRLRDLLAQTAKSEQHPVRDVVPSAMMRLRLRRHSVTNANELLEGFVSFVRGLATLFSLPSSDERTTGRRRPAQKEPHG